MNDKYGSHRNTRKGASQGDRFIRNHNNSLREPGSEIPLQSKVEPEDIKVSRDLGLFRQMAPVLRFKIN